MRMQGHFVPEELREMVKKNAGAYKTVFGVNYPEYMKDQEKKGINPLDAYINLMGQLAKAPDFTDKMRIFGQLSHGQQAAAATTALVGNKPRWLEQRARVGEQGSEVFDKDFAEAMRGSITSVAQFDENLAQLTRRLGDGFTPVVQQANAALGGLNDGLAGVERTFPALTSGVLAAAGGLVALVAIMGTVGVVAPAVASGFTLISGALAAMLGSIAAVPAAVAAATAGILKVGSDHETPENRAALERLAGDRRSPEGGPNGRLYDGYDATGRPAKAEVTIRAEPGTTVTGVKAAPGVQVNAGPTLNRP